VHTDVSKGCIALILKGQEDQINLKSLIGVMKRQVVLPGVFQNCKRTISAIFCGVLNKHNVPELDHKRCFA